MKMNRLPFIYAKALCQSIIYSETIERKKKKEQSLYSTAPLVSSDSTLPDFLPFHLDTFVIGEELILIRAILISSNFIHNLFKNPTFSENEKFEIILAIFPGLTITTKSFLKVLMQRKHLVLLPEISEQFNEILFKFRKLTKVKLIVASGLEENVGSTLLPVLKKITKANEVVLNLTYDPKLIGGFILEYNSVAIDVSLLKQFSPFVNDI
jgi:ATP synthase F1 delta subunit